MKKIKISVLGLILLGLMACGSEIKNEKIGI